MSQSLGRVQVKLNKSLESGLALLISINDTPFLKAQLHPTFPICGRPRPRKVFLQCFDQIACVHMSGLFVRSHMNAGQDGFRDESSKQESGLIEDHWNMRIFSRRGSTDHTICSLSRKFWHQLSTVAVELLPVSG